eukprot:jgi/Tetstr1/456611/TSEL_043314.t1
MDYNEMYQRVKRKACVLGNLSVEGLGRTQEEVVSRELSGLKDASSLEELKDVLLDATDNLKQLDIFDVVEVRMNAGEQREGQADTADISVKVKESNLLKLHAGSYVNQNSEGSLEASVTVKNYLGWAERTEASFEYGSQNSNEYCLSYFQPYFTRRTNQVQARVFHSRQNNQRHCSFTEDMNGASVTVSSKDGQHELTADGGWQEISDRAKTASQAIRQQLGYRNRLTASYVWKQQYLIEPDEEGLPYGIAGLKSTSQLGAVAPMGGAVGFAKQVLSGMVMLPLSDTSDLTFSAKAGLLIPLGGQPDASSTCITDRFFLGGTSTLRGFRTRGIGPTDARRIVPKTSSDSEESAISGPPIARDALGGDLMCSVLAELNFKLPHPALQALGVKGHVFVNGGNIMLFHGDNPVKERLQEFASTFRVAMGAGVYIPTMMGRFEMNYCRVLTSQVNDRPKHGLQFGFMSGFL